MSTERNFRQFILSIRTIPQQIIRYISSAAIRIFSPSDDNYPETGVQPYEGDPADKQYKQ